MDNKCKDLTKDVCDQKEECKYAEGDKRNYCRSATRRVYKGLKKATSFLTKAFRPNKTAKNKVNVNNSSASYKTADSGSIEFENAEDIPEYIVLPKINKTAKNKWDRAIAKYTIRKNIKNNVTKIKENIRINYLKTVCSDSHVCIAFGTESAKIRKLFDNFSNFNLLSQPLKTIGKESANGFVKELTYTKDGYVANAILKSSSDPGSDNLLYEEIVGIFLNKIGKYVPCFLETYGVYKYTSKAFYNKMKDNNIVNQINVVGNLQYLTEFNTNLIKYACSDQSQYLAIIIQYLKDAKTLKDMYNDISFRKNHLIEILFQIYMPLAHLTNIFTHYDLHSSNVLIYKPVNNGYIEYSYHLKDGNIVKFKSPYIAKIIDYGRSFFYDNKNRSSMWMSDVVTKVCDTTYRHGFYYLFQPEYHYISSSYYNQSHDLRLLYILKMRNLKKQDITEPVLLEMYDKLKYDYKHGTQSRDSGYPNSLNNCKDAFKFLTHALMDPTFINRNDSEFENSTKIGELHVYIDGKPMEFINE